MVYISTTGRYFFKLHFSQSDFHISLNNRVFGSVSAPSHKHTSQFLLKVDVPLPHLVLSFLLWRDRKLRSGALDVLLYMVYSVSRCCWEDELKFMCLQYAYALNTLLRHFIPPLGPLNCVPMVAVVKWCSVCSAEGGVIYSYNCCVLLLPLTFLVVVWNKAVRRLSHNTWQVFSLSAGLSCQISGALVASCDHKHSLVD